MADSEKIINAFKDKLEEMSETEREEYLKRMGFSFDEEGYVSISTDSMNARIEKLDILFRYQDLNALEKEIDKNRTQLAHTVAEAIAESDNSKFALGRYVGFSEAIESQLVRLYNEEDFRVYLDSLDSDDIYDMIRVLLFVRNHGGIKIEDMINKIDIKQGKMNTIVGSLVGLGFLRFSRPGTYAYYYISDSGNRYLNNNRALIRLIKKLANKDSY